MKKLSVAFASFLLTVATYAAYVGVMADTVTGNVALPALESRIGDWNAITNRPASVATAFSDAPTFGWVGQFVSDAIEDLATTNDIGSITNEPLWKANSNAVLTHVGLTASNVHGVTAAMIGAVTSNDFTNGIAQAVDPLVSTSTLTSTLGGYSTTGDTASAIAQATANIMTNAFAPLWANYPASSDVTIGQHSQYAQYSKQLIFSGGDVTNRIFALSGTIYMRLNEDVASKIVRECDLANYTNVFRVDTASAKSFRKVDAGVTSTIPTSVTYNGTNYVPDTNGLVNLGTIVGVDPNAWQKSDTVTNAVDLFARRAATNAQGMASNSWQRGDSITNAVDGNAWHKGDVVTGVVASAVDEYARSLAASAAGIANAATPQSRKIVINGVTNDLTQDRTFSIDTNRFISTNDSRNVNLSGTFAIRNSRVMRESTLASTLYAFTDWGTNIVTGDSGLSFPMTLTNTATTRTNINGHTRISIQTTNAYERSSGTIAILAGTNVVASFNPSCDGSVDVVDYDYADSNETITLRLDIVPDPITNANPIILSMSVFTMADITQKDEDFIDTRNQKIGGSWPTLPRQWSTKEHAEYLMDQATVESIAEIRARTADTDLQGHNLRYNPRFDAVSSSNSLSWKYAGQTIMQYDGEGAAVVPEIKAFEVGAATTATMTVWSYSGGATNLLPEICTDLVEAVWTRLTTNSIISATNVDAYTAQVVFTNALDRMAFVRLVDVSGGTGTPVTRFFGAVGINGDDRTEWPDGGAGGGISASTATGISYAVIGAATASAFSNVVFGATSTVMCATGTWYDAATRTAYTTSCPSGTGGGAAMTNSVDVATVSTNVSGVWAVDFRNGAAQRFTQVGAITSQTFAVDSTAKVSTARIVLRTTTNAITWSTNLVRFVPNSIPIHATNANAVFYFEAHAGAVRAVYLGVDP